MSRRHTIETEPIVGKDFEMKEPFNGNINTIGTVKERSPVETINNGQNGSNKKKASSTKKAIFGVLGMAVVGGLAYAAYTLFTKHFDQNQNQDNNSQSKSN